MKYKFKCPQCQQVEEVEMSISEYAEYEAMCEECRVKMERIYEMPQVKGDDDASSGDLSCGASCSSCAGCGI